jgi:hypothetical protein
MPRSAEEWLRRTEDADAIILSWGLPNEVLRQSERLRVISFCGTGASDHVDLDVAAEKGITMLPVRGYGDNAVADYVLGLLFSVLMRVPAADLAVRSGEWRDDPHWDSHWTPRWELKGKRSASSAWVASAGGSPSLPAPAGWTWWAGRVVPGDWTVPPVSSCSPWKSCSAPATLSRCTWR